MRHWTIADISWDQFNPSLVDPKLLPIVKTAAVVEHNGRHYVQYLHNVFNDDELFKTAATYWGDEEVQHGVALGKWAELADPTFSFEQNFKRFSEGYTLPLDTTRSVRGSKTGELIARCIVETGTSSFYTALGEATREPVLKEVCRKIAADEFRHYKLFYDYLKRYSERDKLNLLQRIWIVVKRIQESNDDELSYAYYTSNNIKEPYNRKKAQEEYGRLAYSLYKPPHIERLVGMIMKAIGINPQGKVSKVAFFLMSHWMKNQAQKA